MLSFFFCGSGISTPFDDMRSVLDQSTQHFVCLRLCFMMKSFVSLGEYCQNNVVSFSFVLLLSVCWFIKNAFLLLLLVCFAICVDCIVIIVSIIGPKWVLVIEWRQADCLSMVEVYGLLPETHITVIEYEIFEINSWNCTWCQTNNN